MERYRLCFESRCRAMVDRLYVLLQGSKFPAYQVKLLKIQGCSIVTAKARICSMKVR